ncbi:MAG TPA: DoxX family protein [Candidatus Nanopelagicales bacterium]
MNIALWIAAGVLAAAFLAVGGLKVSTPRAKLQERMAWVEDFTDGQVKAIGAIELLGAIGVVVPGILKIAPILVPLAATGLAITMLLAFVMHARRGEAKESLGTNLVLLALALFVAWGRFGPYAF